RLRTALERDERLRELGQRLCELGPAVDLPPQRDRPLPCLAFLLRLLKLALHARDPHLDNRLALNVVRAPQGLDRPVLELERLTRPVARHRDAPEVAQDVAQ